MNGAMAEHRIRARRSALRDAAKAVCADCAGQAFPGDDMPLAGPNRAMNYVHVRPVTSGHQVTLCAASSIWALIRWEWDNAEVASLSPRGWREDIPADNPTGRNES